MRKIALASLLLVACDPATAPLDAPATDAGMSDAPGSDVPGADAPATDAPGADAPGVACVPTAGSAMGDAYCDQFFLSLFTSDDGAPRMELRGRLEPNDLAAGGCAVVDEIEVQVGGTTITTLEGTWGPVGVGGTRLIAEGATFPALTERCAADEDRFGGFGFVVHGRIDGGAFTAECADAEGGSRWPPAVTVSCHHNIDAVPFSAYAMVMPGSAFTYTSLDVSLPHGPGAAITTAESTIHIIPGFATGFGGPIPDLEPFDSTGWTTSVFENSGGFGPYSAVQSRLDSALPIELCPSSSAGPPGPGEPLPPVFLARIRGTSERGAFSAEAYVNNCRTFGAP
jgi:hypothetical protein